MILAFRGNYQKLSLIFIGYITKAGMMLVLTRKLKGNIKIREDFIVVVVQITRGAVKAGIEALEDVGVSRDALDNEGTEGWGWNLLPMK